MSKPENLVVKIDNLHDLLDVWKTVCPPAPRKLRRQTTSYGIGSNVVEPMESTLSANGNLDDVSARLEIAFGDNKPEVDVSGRRFTIDPMDVVEIVEPPKVDPFVYDLTGEEKIDDSEVREDTRWGDMGISEDELSESRWGIYADGYRAGYEDAMKRLDSLDPDVMVDFHESVDSSGFFRNEMKRPPYSWESK